MLAGGVELPQGIDRAVTAADFGKIRFVSPTGVFHRLHSRWIATAVANLSNKPNAAECRSKTTNFDFE